jgi:DNA-binding HxlR family transcriptional regulator
VLSGCLTELAGAGIIERTVDVEPPVTVSYRPSASGFALLPALDELAAWAGLNLVKAPPPRR